MEYNVKRIFFETDENNTLDIFPTYELENGDIKRHRYLFDTNMWMTDSEFETAAKYVAQNTKPWWHLW